MFEAIRKDNGEPIAGTLVELKGRSFILTEGMGTIGLSCKGVSSIIGEYTDTIISGFVEVLSETVHRPDQQIRESPDGQIQFEGDFEKPKEELTFAKKKKKWENDFQKWSNEQSQKGEEAYGACGYGSMCDYCKDNSYGRPCVRALNEMCRDKFICLDYDKLTYEDAWCGIFSKSEEQQ